jgi:transcriptional regulator with GAF, ATPase, and Fis domain
MLMAARAGGPLGAAARLVGPAVAASAYAVDVGRPQPFRGWKSIASPFSQRVLTGNSAGHAAEPYGRREDTPAIITALEQTSGNQTQAARLLRLTSYQLRYKKRKLSLP